MMRILLLLTILAASSLNTEKKCKNFFSGKWKYDRYDVEYIYVERNLEKQFEFMVDGEYYYEFDITWISDCQYELTYVGTTGSVPAVAKVGEKFTIEILKINDTLTEYKIIFRDLEEVGAMYRMK